MFKQIGTSPDPADNVEITLTLAAGNKRYEVRSLSFTLVTDANVANRIIRLDFTDASDNLMFSLFASVVVTASQTANFTAGKGLSALGSVETAQTIRLPDDLVLEAGQKIKTNTTALQATDNYGIMTAYGKDVPLIG